MPTEKPKKQTTKVIVQMPDLGLTKKEQNEVRKAFRNVLVSTLEGKERRARPKPSESLPPQVIYVHPKK